VDTQAGEHAQVERASGALHGAAPLVIVANPNSEAARSAVDFAHRLLRQAGRPAEVLQAPRSGDLAATARRAAALATEVGGAVIAAGGDGTASMVADALLAHGRDHAVPPRPLGVLPLGTFNFFARAHAVPAEPAAAARVWLRGQLAPVQVGLVNGRAFLVHAALGLYPELLEDREHFNRRYGRTRAVALWAGLHSLVRGGGALELTTWRDGRRQEVRATTLFVGNNRPQLERIGVAQAACVDQGLLAVLWLRPASAFHRLWLALRGAVGELGGADAVVGEAIGELSVMPRRMRWLADLRPIQVATDGEVVRLLPPVRFAVSPTPLQLLVPPAQ
jgi:diacylglycerol kinase family enzyme